MLNKGVLDWFDRINKFGENLGLEIKHYVISCGLKPMIEGSPIFDKFEKVFACDYIYDKNGVALWPALAINYTSKLQFLFRINKGIEKVSDHEKMNIHMNEDLRPVPQENMIYIGDGLTDVPCMTLLKEKGGRSIAIYPRGKQEKVAQLVEDGRVNHICRGDYSANSEIEKIIKLIIDQISINDTLSKKAIDTPKN